MTQKCATPPCDNQVVAARLCRQCYSGVYYWMKKGVKSMMARRHRLQVFQERIDSISPSKVAHLHAKRQRRA